MKLRKIITFFIISILLLCQNPAAISDNLPDLPVLPDFDTVVPPDGIDAFSPSSTPAKIAQPKPENTQTPAAKTSTTPSASVKQQPAAKAPSVVITEPAIESKKPAAASKKTIKTNSTAIIPRGKKFKVRLQQTVSDKTAEGTRISFVSSYPETSTYVTIPAGTVFRGRISDSHPPYITGNGGLIVIKVDQIIYKGKTYDIDAKVSVANGKHIFFNNIKGKRMYFQSIPKAMRPGTKFFKKMWRVTCNLAKNESGVEIILTPFSFLTGTLVYAVNFVASPVLAIFYKGKSITIPSGSPFTIQLREDAVLF